jgi:Bacterial Ig-like domain (group 1)
MRKLGAASACALLLSSLGAGVFAPASVAASGPLAPESFFASSSEVERSSYSLRSIACDPGGESTATFVVTGVAEGTHTGTFTETLTVSFGPQVDGGPATISALEAEFRLEAEDGSVITGTKELLPDDPSFTNLAACAVFDPPAMSGDGCEVLSILDVNAPVSYEATIAVGGEPAYREQGYATLSAYASERRCEGPQDNTFFFEQQFVYGNEVAPPPEPVVPAEVTLAPASAVNLVGTQHSVTATVTDAAGQGVPNITVNFSVEGVSRSFANTCVTNANGVCTFTYQGSDLPGEDVITGWVDANGNASRDATDPVGTATKTFVLPASTRGEASGGGTLINLAGTGELAFAFNVKSGSDGVHGQCRLRDTATDTKITCLDVQAYVQIGNTATFYGRALVDGAETTYRIQVTDRAEPGSGEDVFLLQTGLGYTAYGVIKDGNIRVR